MSELIYKQDAINAIFSAFSYAYCNNCENNMKDDDSCDECHRKYQNWAASRDTIESVINALPSAEPKRPSEIQDILNYLDTMLHPIISPEHWNVYSELHDMISTLPSTEPRKKGKWIGADSQCGIGCPFCGTPVDDFCSSIDYIDLSYKPNFCPNCGADMTGGEEE